MKSFMIGRTYKFLLPVLVATVLFVPACDSNETTLRMSISVEREGKGGVRVQSNTTGIDLICDFVENELSTERCSGSYPDVGVGGTVQIEAIPDPGRRVSWEGDCGASSTQFCILERVSGDSRSYAGIVVVERTERLAIDPPAVSVGREPVVVTLSAFDFDGNAVDMGESPEVEWEIINQRFAEVIPANNPTTAEISPRQTGQTQVVATFEGKSVSAPVTVDLGDQAP
jgi:hypothetical protein